jgi:glycosyltransferase involved in cell wall biosynthesis
VTTIRVPNIESERVPLGRLGAVPGTDAVSPGAGPPPWPKADRPLKIALIGWARLSLQQKDGSGYNLSASELAAGLALSGHEVSYLRSGMDYSLKPGMRIEHVETWRGVRCDHVINSPNLAIGRFNFNNLVRETSSPDQTAMVMKWLDERGARIVHVHSLEGFSLDLLHAVKRSGRLLFITPHNHWYVCAQVDLLAREVEVCLDYEGGRRCVGCLPETVPAKEIKKRKIGQALHKAFGQHVVKSVRETRLAWRDYVRSKLRRGPAPILPGPRLNPRLAEPPAQISADAAAMRDVAVDACEHGGDPLLGGPAIVKSSYDANERIARNTPVHLKVLNNYGERRRAGIEAANQADLVLGPSRSLLSVLTSMGLEQHKARFLAYGQPHLDELNRLARASEFYHARPWDEGNAARPLRFAFHGTVHNNKGLEILVRAIGMLEPRLRRRAQFLIRAWGDDRPFRRRLARFPEVVFEGGFDVSRLPYLMGTFDVGILPHVWLENCPLVMLEFLNAGKFVVASRLGGPAEFIREIAGSREIGNRELGKSAERAGGAVGGVAGGLGNGMLFAGGDASGLCTCLTRLISGEVLVPSAAEVHAASMLQSYVGHVTEVQAAYAEVMAKLGTGSGSTSGLMVAAAR